MTRCRVTYDEYKITYLPEVRLVFGRTDREMEVEDGAG